MSDGMKLVKKYIFSHFLKTGELKHTITNSKVVAKHLIFFYFLLNQSLKKQLFF